MTPYIDAVGALTGTAAVAFNEGRDAWRGDACCGPLPAGGVMPAAESDSCGCAPGGTCCS